MRLLAREDLRHLLKHKRTYCPQALTPTERRVLQRRSWVRQAWFATGKPRLPLRDPQACCTGKTTKGRARSPESAHDCPRRRVRTREHTARQDPLHHRRLARHRAGHRAARRARRRECRDRRQVHRAQSEAARHHPHRRRRSRRRRRQGPGAAMRHPRRRRRCTPPSPRRSTRFGGIDILVNNASAIWLRGTLDTPMKRFDLMQQVNARGTLPVRAGLPAAPAEGAEPAHPHAGAAAVARSEMVGRRIPATRWRRWA